MPDYRLPFLLANLAIACYNVGTIWAHEVDIFRSWPLLDPAIFHDVQRVHWRKLPYWVLLPFGLSLAGAVALVWYHPAQSPVWAVWSNLASQLLALILTLFFLGQWQAQLSRDPLGPRSPFLEKIPRTHWVRTGLVSATGAVLFAWTLQVVAAP